MERADFEVGGMSCGHCVAAVRRTLEEQDGVRVENVEIGSARITYDPARTSPDRLAAVITEEGYEAKVVGSAG
jgi:copper chaperone